MVIGEQFSRNFYDITSYISTNNADMEYKNCEATWVQACSHHLLCGEVSYRDKHTWSIWTVTIDTQSVDQGEETRGRESEDGRGIGRAKGEDLAGWGCNS